MSEQKLNELLSSKEFIESIIKLNTAEEVKAEFSKKGVTISDEELEGIRTVIAAKVNKGKSGEVSEQALDDVVGGKLNKNAKIALYTTLGVIGVTGVAVGGIFLESKLHVVDKVKNTFSSGSKSSKSSASSTEDSPVGPITK